MEITFTPGLSEEAEKMIERKVLQGDETVFEASQRKKKDSKKEKKQQRKLEIKQKIELKKQQNSQDLTKMKKRQIK